MTKKYRSYGMAVVGLALLGVALFLIKTQIDPRGIEKTLPYILVGLGCGIFGHGTGDIISQRVLKNCPDIQKQTEINAMDERNVAIASLAKARAYDLMIFVFGALMLALALMNVDIMVTLLLVSAYLFVVCCEVYYRCKLEKEM